MADSKLATKNGLMLAAAAYKVKYRACGSNGQVLDKIRLLPQTLGCHRKNRGGTYPGGLRLQDLLQTIAKHGFLAEELDHRCTVVEEMPLSEILRRSNYQSSLEYNVAQCAKDALLHGLFSEPFNAVLHSLLARNHAIMLSKQ